MSIIKWFKGLFSNKYKVVYDPARDGGSSCSLQKVAVTKTEGVNEGVSGRRIFLIMAINNLETNDNGYLKSFILNIDIDHLKKGDVLSTECNRYTFIICKDTMDNRFKSGYRYSCKPYGCWIPENKLKVGDKIFKIASVSSDTNAEFVRRYYYGETPPNHREREYGGRSGYDDSDVYNSLLLNPLSPVSMWSSSSDDCSSSSHSSHDSHSSYDSSSYDSGGSDSGGGDCGGGGD